MNVRRSDAKTDVGDRATASGPKATGEQEFQFDHERLDVYRVALEFLDVVSSMLAKGDRDIRDQLSRASLSIVGNIAEGAGKTSRPDKRRFYEIARGSATECASYIEVLRIRGHITATERNEARSLLIRVAQMLSRLCSTPR